MVDEYLKNIEDCYKVYKIVGIYRPKDVHIGHRIYGFFLRLIFIDIFLLLQTLYFTHVGNIIDFADLLSMQLTWVSISAKSYMLINKFETLEDIVKNLRDLLNFASENQINFGSHLKRRMASIRKVFIVYWSTCPFTIIMGCISVLLATKEPPYIPHYKLYPPPFFNFEQNYNYFLIIEFIDVIGPIIAATTAVSMDFLCVFFFSMGAGLLEELAERVKLIETEFKMEAKNKILENDQQVKMDDLVKHHNNKNVKDLRKCIEIHAKIKEFLIDSQNLVSPIVFIQVVISTAVIGMTCYTISMFSPADGAAVFFRQITYMMPMGLQIFIPCYFGNEIMLAAEKFSMEMFHTKWYHGCKEFRKAFSILLVHTTRPLIMICGIIFQITLENFLAVSQLTYKFYAVMQNQNAK